MESTSSTTPIYKPKSLTNTKPKSCPRKFVKLHKDLWACECVDSNGREIKGVT